MIKNIKLLYDKEHKASLQKSQNGTMLTNSNLKNEVIQMKQQHFNQKPRSRDSQQQQFRFVEFPENNQFDRNRPRGRSRKHQSGFGQWSDLVANGDSQELQVPFSDDGSISISTNNFEDSSLSDGANSKEHSNEHPSTVVKAAAKTQSQPPASYKKDDQRGKDSIPFKEVNSMPLSIKTNQKKMQSLSPFTLPSNISEVKPRESPHFGSGRNSEQLFLDLLNQEQQNINSKEKQTQEKNIEKQTKKQEPKIKESEKNQNNTRKTQKQVQKIQSKQAIKKERETMAIKKPRESVVPMKQYQKQLQNNTKAKRVTINDRGKIKFPTDSISGQFQYLLPLELRESASDSSKKRRLVIEEEGDDEDKVVPKKDEPMDIVDPREEAESIIRHRQKEAIKQAQQKLQDLIQNSPKPQLPKISKRQSQNIPRVGDKHKENDSRPSSKQSHQQSTNKGQGSTTVGKKTVEDKGPMVKKPKSEALIAQKKRRKIKKQEQTEVQLITTETAPQVRERPKRKRVGKTQFWMNQKPLYKNGALVGVKNVNDQQFLEIIGFHSAQDIISKPSSFLFTTLKISMIIILRPKEKWYSSGINKMKMQKHQLSSNHYNQIEITLCDKVVDSGKISAFIDDVCQVQINQGMKISQGETFSLENHTSSERYLISVCFYNGKKDQQDEKE